MISFNLLGRYGRLGNQMFQYAALLSISRNSGTEFCIPRASELESSSDRSLFGVFDLGRARYRGYQKNVQIVMETSFSYDRDIHFNCPKNADLKGYFQSEKYFRDISSIVREEFKFKNEVSAYAKKIRNRFSKPAISLHVRRGDYLQHQDIWPVCSIDYYSSALALFPRDYHVLIFSDDIAWCKSQELFKEDKRFIFISGHPNYYDLCIMKHCDHHIIANSSFSWWGAWLGGNPHKKIVAPRRWFGETGRKSQYDTSDLIPEEWVVL